MQQIKLHGNCSLAAQWHGGLTPRTSSVQFHHQARTFQKASEEFFANEGVVCNNTVFSHMSWIIVIKVVIYVSSGFRVGYLLFRRPVVEMSRASILQCKECFEC